jgi:HTH-type transcriptional regulator/antitoxin HigA
MNVRPIRNARDHARALREIETLWQSRAGTPDGDRFEVLSTLVDAYEREAFPIDPSDPIQAIRFRIEQGQVGAPELLAIFGTRARWSEILGKRRRLTLPMIRALHAKLGIPLESLVREYRLRAPTTTKRAA